MAKTATLHARIDEKLKINAENIFADLGLSASDAIKLFYRQVELNGGLPFEIKIPEKAIAERKLMKELELGERSAENGGSIDLETSRKKYFE